ncbi:MAG TPA: asparagine synthase (glutamine-hydrolyzing) [Vicinamibacterales bacterium]|nr:asparagine synthase (glutamine-hydrolyzing) [Vicinamibacterales bacterium]
MCGLAGFWSTRATEDALAIATGMASRLAHRGPDDEGCWVDVDAGIALAHRRLSIVDLSPMGHQPMMSSTGRFLIAFNGEIYNHRELRRELARDACFVTHDVRLDATLRGQSDTEVMLAAIETWGLRRALDRFVGMFAFALWDRGERELSLVRDRLGVKPLYYGWTGGTLLFGSELKALAAHPDFDATINRDAVALLLRYAYIPAPHSIYARIHKVMPGTMLRVRAPHPAAVSTVTYWSADDISAHGLAHPFTGSPEEAASDVERLLRDAVGLRMIADVPIGAFLSGGIDSSTVTALMQAQSTRPVQTFTIGSFDRDCDEASAARAVAHHLGTDHTELYVSPQDAVDAIPQMPSIYDEPFADPSQVPTYLLARLTRQHVTVALSGDGGDELFAGYNRHVWGPRIWSALQRLPNSIRAGSAQGLAAISPQAWTTAFEMVEGFLPARWRHRAAGDKLHKLARILSASTAEQFYALLASRWHNPTEAMLDAIEPAPGVTAPATFHDLANRMLYLDLVTYLPDDILVKVDRATMACGLEAREPLLDHRLVEFAWRLPMRIKLGRGESKWPLRQVLYKLVPKQLVERAKSGFGVPIGAWLRGPLRPWAEELLSARRLAADGFFNPGVIQQKWSDHVSARTNCQDELWAVLMFQAWLAARDLRPATVAGSTLPTGETAFACSVQ